MGACCNHPETLVNVNSKDGTKLTEDGGARLQSEVEIRQDEDLIIDTKSDAKVAGQL